MAFGVALRLRTVVAFAVAATLASCGSGTTAVDSPTTTVAPSTTSSAAPPSTTTTAAAGCAGFGSTDQASGAAHVTRSPAVALLRNVQVQTSGCVDEIAFLFWGGTPGWTAGYTGGPLTEDPSGLPADVPGRAHLLIRLEPASGVDLAGDHPAVTYDGPTTVHPAAPSTVTQVRRLGDFEAVTAWVVGLPAQRPFEVVVRPDQLVVRLSAGVRRTTACAVPGTRATVAYPTDWYTESSDRWACRYFDPSPFPVYPATDETSWAVTVQTADGPASDVVANMTAGGGDVGSRTTRIGGVPVTVLDITESGGAMLPAGYQYRMYVFATAPGALLVMGTPAPPGPQADRNRSAADAIAASLRIA